MSRLGPLALAGAALLSAVPPSGPSRIALDDFRDVSGWTAAPSDGVSLSLSSDAGEKGRALRLDFDFGGKAGWAAARKAFPRRLPENYAFELRLKGSVREFGGADYRASDHVG